jgi:hypothetical protein
MSGGVFHGGGLGGNHGGGFGYVDIVLWLVTWAHKSGLALFPRGLGLPYYYGRAGHISYPYDWR